MRFSSDILDAVSTLEIDTSKLAGSFTKLHFLEGTMAQTMKYSFEEISEYVDRIKTYAFWTSAEGLLLEIFDEREEALVNDAIKLQLEMIKDYEFKTSREYMILSLIEHIETM